MTKLLTAIAYLFSVILLGIANLFVHIRSNIAQATPYLNPHQISESFMTQYGEWSIGVCFLLGILSVASIRLATGQYCRTKSRLYFFVALTTTALLNTAANLLAFIINIRTFITDSEVGQTIVPMLLFTLPFFLAASALACVMGFLIARYALKISPSSPGDSLL